MWILGQGKNNVEENEGGRERQDSQQEEDRRAERMELDVELQVLVQERDILKEMEQNIMQGRGTLGMEEKKKWNQGTWKKMVREMRNDGDQLGENNKENFRSTGMKRVRGQNEVEGRTAYGGTNNKEQ